MIDDTREGDRIVEDLIRDENMKLYRRLLSESTDEEQRRVLLVLLRLLVAEQNEDCRSSPPAFPSAPH
ncbi:MULTISPECIES: hypothetical protein [Rhodopseudomonas]|uniref:Uncharacterized protein n=1 Tax=Rhodopseudomonas palustris TaxID=1076 RepID=A0A0D7F520_RHOPL|nr:MULTISPECIES: hypothetical protein [Rhodopseudomonas]KIZ47891.1 hypothetical protein OO17_01790 [Rhodopseudomonas palustris]MDF3810717.1 hypothetical protein [Rhodopseudomonas sp. BAL398]WOK20523.1 hypothetical protein RBJ75_13820 [Rhodopseudomonas sp. BAL398]